MPNPLIRIHDTNTNEIIDREMTDSEATEYAIQLEIIETNKAASDALKESADAKLTAFYESIGLTPDEIAAKL